MPFDTRSARLHGRIGGLVTASRHDSRRITEKARATYRASFLIGHACKVCPPEVIPPDLDEVERARRAVALRRAHFGRLAARRVA